MSKISKNVLIIGQSFLAAALAVTLGYLLSVKESGAVNINADVFGIFLENMIFSLVLLWGGAFLIDYAEKTGNE